MGTNNMAYADDIEGIDHDIDVVCTSHIIAIVQPRYHGQDHR